ncbi:MAG: tRNA epoxyqueuosine(34) reductase QueG [Prevotella sp.]|nr:tRNA epoxyqueuosine(34) reductase QueG [Prevotella sp.]MCM1074855.1 tRNA epoxyqueuosine(34) reductase QueG [Ruminococcus sp.]
MTDWAQIIKRELREAGATGVGIAGISRIPEEVWRSYELWLQSGRAGSLGYMSNYPQLRQDPRELMPEAQSSISIAWPYLPKKLRSPDKPFIARYAYGPDYHKSIRRILKPIIKRWETDYGIKSRICVDSAPILERYWAVRAGVGFIGRNGCLIVPGYGSWVFLSEILITADLPEDEPCRLECAGCGACIKVCPAQALGADGYVDCRRCLSALTLESPGNAPKGLGTLAGCDRCQEVCIHNKEAKAHNIQAFATLTQIFNLTADELRHMSAEEFKCRMAGTALLRPGLEGLLANLSRLQNVIT